MLRTSIQCRARGLSSSVHPRPGRIASSLDFTSIFTIVFLLIVVSFHGVVGVAGVASEERPVFHTTHQPERQPQAIIPLFPSKTNGPFSGQIIFLEQNHQRTLVEGVRHVAHRGSPALERVGIYSFPDANSSQRVVKTSRQNDIELETTMTITDEPSIIYESADVNDHDDAVHQSTVPEKESPRSGVRRMVVSLHRLPLLPKLHAVLKKTAASFKSRGFRVAKPRMPVRTIPIADMPRSHFVGPVSFGTPPQTFWLIFDTGSTNLQVVGKKCIAPSCLRVPRYDPSRSPTFSTLIPSVHLDVTFGTGRVHSVLGTDQVSLGPFVVPNQTFGVIESELEDRPRLKNIFDDIDFQGLLGLGFPSLSAAGRTPFFDNILRQWGNRIVPEFSLYMSDPHTAPKIKDSQNVFPSALFLGGVDPRFYIPPIRYVPVVREHYWEVEMEELWVGSTKFCCDGPTKKSYVIFDSGTSFNSIPHNEAARFFSLFPDNKCSLQSAASQTKDSEYAELAKTYPNITYKLTRGVDIVLTPEMYLLENSKGFCIPAYMQIDVPSQFGHAYILGAVAYMQHYFTVFRRASRPGESAQVGIARARHTSSGRNFLKGLGKDAMAL